MLKRSRALGITSLQAGSLSERVCGPITVGPGRMFTFHLVLPCTCTSQHHETPISLYNPHHCIMYFMPVFLYCHCPCLSMDCSHTAHTLVGIMRHELPSTWTLLGWLCLLPCVFQELLCYSIPCKPNSLPDRHNTLELGIGHLAWYWAEPNTKKRCTIGVNVLTNCSVGLELSSE